MLVLSYGLSGSCQRPWGSSPCDRPDWGRMKLEEVRKVTLTSAVTSHCLSVDCGQKPGCFRSNAAEQTKHFAHLAFSYFIYSTSLKVFSISKKRFLFFIFFLLHLFFSPPTFCFSPVQTRWPWNPWLLHAAMVMWETAVGAQPEGPRSCPGCKDKVKTKQYAHTHVNILIT